MKPNVELLEDRCVMSAASTPVATIAPLNVNLLNTPQDNQWGWDRPTLHYIAPSETAGTWVLFSDTEDHLIAQFVTMHADVRSLGLLIQPGSLTLFVVTPESLQQSASFDAGQTWAPWQVTVSLINPPTPTGFADPSFVFLAGMDEANPPLMFGKIDLSQPNAIRVGWQDVMTGQLFSGVVTNGTLTVHEFDSFWTEATWFDEVQLWSAT